MMCKRLALLLVLVSLFTMMFASVSTYAAAESETSVTAVEDTYEEGVSLVTRFKGFLGRNFKKLADIGRINYSRVSRFTERKLNEVFNHFGFKLNPGIPMLLFSIVVLLCGVVFFVFGVTTWKVLLRVVYYVIAYFVGYYGMAALLTVVPTLQHLPLSGYYPIAFGIILGLVGCFFPAFCLRVSLFMGCIGAAYVLFPRIVTPMINEKFIFSYAVLMLCYLTVGALVGYLVAFRFMRPLLLIGAVVLAGTGVTFGLFSLFLDGILANIGLSVDLFFWIISGGVALLALALAAIRGTVAKKRESKLAMEAAA